MLFACSKSSICRYSHALGHPRAAWHEARLSCPGRQHQACLLSIHNHGDTKRVHSRRGSYCRLSPPRCSPCRLQLPDMSENCNGHSNEHALTASNQAHVRFARFICMHARFHGSICARVLQIMSPAGSLAGSLTRSVCML